jgi:prepilin-type N-terminal cleavage/methylation domain-containing protein
MAQQRIELVARQRRGAVPYHGRAASRRGGFTLIEISLALMLFSMGVLAVFLLFGRALDRESDALRYTRMALFGDSVLESLQAKSEYLTETASSNEWSQFWEDLSDGQTQVVCAAASSNGVWEGEMSVAADGLQTNFYYAYPLHGQNATGLLSHIIRYKMKVDIKGGLDDFERDLVQVTLKVWEGEFGSEFDDDGLVFITLYADRGRVE